MPLKSIQLDKTAQLAEELSLLTYKSLTVSDKIQLKKLLLDHVGVCRRGAEQAWCVTLQNWAKKYNLTGASPVFGTEFTTAPNVAALLNAAAAHGMELDDTHDSSISHPGAAVIAAALAVGAHENINGKKVMPAIVAGYEAIGRIGRAVGADDVIEYGYHPTALFGGFGVAVTAGKLLGLSGSRIASAWGLLLSMAGGSMQFSEDPFGTTVKRLHGGYAAHNGILAAEFASLGIDGPKGSIDGRFGLANLFGKKPDFDELSTGSDNLLEIHKISLKPYPCCRLFHSTIDALIEVMGSYPMDPSDISKIRIGGPRIMVTQHMMRRPESIMAAQYSLPFTIATSFINNPSEYESYTEKYFNDQSILSLCDIVDAEEDEELEGVFPEHFGSWVEIVTQNGKSKRSKVIDSIGTPENPMKLEDIEMKISNLLSKVQLAPSVRDIGDAIENITQDGEIRRLVSLFSSKGSN